MRIYKRKLDGVDRERGDRLSISLDKAKFLMTLPDEEFTPFMRNLLGWFAGGEVKPLANPFATQILKDMTEEQRRIVAAMFDRCETLAANRARGDRGRQGATRGDNSHQYNINGNERETNINGNETIVTQPAKSKPVRVTDTGLKTDLPFVPVVGVKAIGDLMGGNGNSMEDKIIRTPVSAALEIIGEQGNSRTLGFMQKACHKISTKCFIEVLQTFYSKMKQGELDSAKKPAAILTNELKKLMALKDQEIASAQ